MAYWVSNEQANKIDALKWHVFDIPNGYVPGRAGVAVLKHSANDIWGDIHIFVDGVVAARRRGGGDWGFTINAFVPAGCNVSFGHGGGGSIDYFKFMEF